jgi:hypothetical protein
MFGRRLEVSICLHLQVLVYAFCNGQDNKPNQPALFFVFISFVSFYAVLPARLLIRYQQLQQSVRSKFSPSPPSPLSLSLSLCPWVTLTSQRFSF